MNGKTMRHNKSSCIDAAGIGLHEFMNKNVAMACYRMPKEDKIRIVMQTSANPLLIRSHTEINHTQGFVIKPFEQNSRIFAYLIRPEITFTYPFTEPFPDLSVVNKLAINNGTCNTNIPVEETSQDEFIAQVKTIQSHEQKGLVQKVVLSRVAIEPRDPAQSPDEVFISLCRLYPEAFVYFFRLPDIGCWMGATPEPFLVLHPQTGVIESIAGTQWLNGLQPEEVVWGRKELEEQDIVTRFIENRLNLLEINSYRKEGPVTTRAGQLAHLQTRFSFSPQLVEHRIGEFIQNFHPTPSVGGYPQDEAYKLIASLEKHKREFYTGIVGPLRIEGKTALFANIRCMKIVENAYWLYMGAGITQASDPVLEWEETNLKKSTIIAAIKHS
jgi:isochorismate synthase